MGCGGARVLVGDKRKGLCEGDSSPRSSPPPLDLEWPLLLGVSDERRRVRRGEWAGFPRGDHLPVGAVAHRHLRPLLLPTVRPLQARHLELVCSASCSSRSLLPPIPISAAPVTPSIPCCCTIVPGTCRWRRAAPSSCASSRSPAGWPRSSPLSRDSCSASPGPARRDAPASPLVASLFSKHSRFLKIQPFFGQILKDSVFLCTALHQ